MTKSNKRVIILKSGYRFWVGGPLSDMGSPLLIHYPVLRISILGRSPFDFLTPYYKKDYRGYKTLKWVIDYVNFTV